MAPSRMRRPRGHCLAALLFSLALVFGGVLDGPALAQPGGRGDGEPPLVTVADVTSRELVPRERFIGAVEAIEATEIVAQVRGLLLERAYEEGALVERGDLLFRIEPDRFEAAVAAAVAEQQSAAAALANAQRAVERARELVAEDTAPETRLEDAATARDQAQARLAAAEAALTQAEIDLADTEITAPLPGRMGPAAVSPGDFVGPQVGPLARLVQLDPVRVVFSVSDPAFGALVDRLGDRMAVAEALVPRIELPDGSIYGETGAIAFIAPTIDPATGTVAMHADFANPAERLLPGQFVTVLVQIGEPEQQIVVPQRAVLEDRQGRFVFIVDEQDRAQRQRIVAERRVDGQWVVSEGLTGGERIVVEGLQSVRPGQPVRPQTEDGQDVQSGDQQGGG